LHRDSLKNNKELGISYSAFNEMLNCKRSLSPGSLACHAKRIWYAGSREWQIVYGETQEDTPYSCCLL